MFSMLGQDLAGVSFLDAFAGSGIMALEAWSRGAEVTAVERNRRALAELRHHLAALDASIRLVAGDVVKKAPTLGRFDIVYADPPFALPAEPIVTALASCVAGRLLLEASEHTVVPDQMGGLVRERIRSFGSVRVHELVPGVR